MLGEVEDDFVKVVDIPVPLIRRHQDDVSLEFTADSATDSLQHLLAVGLFDPGHIFLAAMHSFVRPPDRIGRDRPREVYCNDRQ